MCDLISFRLITVLAERIIETINKNTGEKV
jgi:hypothetical protein